MGCEFGPVHASVSDLKLVRDLSSIFLVHHGNVLGDPEVSHYGMLPDHVIVLDQLTACSGDNIYTKIVHQGNQENLVRRLIDGADSLDTS